MKGNKVFLDSNILVHLADTDIVKRNTVLQIISPSFLISTQVISENINVCLKKLKLSKDEAFAFGRYLISLFEIASISVGTVEKALELCSTLNFSYWDSLIIASALENRCDILYTEDLQNKQVIDNQLTIINPFIR